MMENGRPDAHPGRSRNRGRRVTWKPGEPDHPMGGTAMRLVDHGRSCRWPMSLDQFKELDAYLG